MNDGGLHAFSVIGTVVVLGALGGGSLTWAGGGAGPELNLAEMESIEASLAYKKAEPPRQPQKEKRAPVEEKVEGISRDSDKKPVDKPEDKKPADKPDKDFSSVLDKYRRGDAEDIGTPSDEPIGQFDGSEYGFAEETRGDPYFQVLVRDLRAGWEYPEIAKTEGVPVGCFHITGEGKIVDTKFKEPSGNPELDDSVERAIKALEKQRNQDPVPVPTHLLRAVTTRWTCFRFKL
jgi:outer membrane biosynthesis protein TonB